MSSRPSCGYSLVELMVGCAFGLALLGGVLQLFAMQVRAQREQLVEARLHQDLRAIADLIVRGVRRAGHHSLDDGGANPHRAITLADASIVMSYNRDAIDDGLLDDRERSGFRLAEGAMQAMVGGRWQALTDPAVVRILRFDVAMSLSPSAVAGECVTLVARELSFAIEGHPAADPQRLRRVAASVAVRNDDIDASGCGAATGQRPRRAS